MSENESTEKDKSLAPENTAFSQQRINAWRPLFTPTVALLELYILGIILIVFGAPIYVYLKDLVKIDIRYDDVCGSEKECFVTFKLDKPIEGDIYLHYKLTKFYQNHRRYVFSRDYSQLRGNFVPLDKINPQCQDFITVNDTDNPADLLLPSGAIAVSLFNDTFTWVDTSVANFTDSGISWRTDRDKLYTRLSPNYTEGIKWLEEDYSTQFPGGARNEHFIVWMRTAALPTFYKIYSRCIYCQIPAGEYQIKIENNYPTSLFKGEKHIVLSEVTMIGGKNSYIGLSCIITGVILIIFGFIIMFSHLFFPRKIGDTTFLYKRF